VSRKKNKLLTQYVEQLSIFKKHLKSLRKSIGDEEIHEMRVAIKKLKALLNLMELASEGRFKKSKQLNLFRSLYRKAGEVREAQVNYKHLIQETEVPLPTYTNWLINKEAQAKIHFRAALIKFDVDKLARFSKGTKKKVARIRNKSIEYWADRLISEKLARVSLLVGLNISSELHEIRRLLNASEEILKLVSNRNRAFLKELIRPYHKQIGHWHDLWVLIESLNLFMTEHPENDEKSNILDVRESIINENISLEKDLMLSLAGFLAKTEIH
jgi:CHAD domain-containing protein